MNALVNDFILLLIIKMSDYKELSKKLLENRKISVYEYYQEIVAKNIYKSRYEELYKDNLRLDRFNDYLLSFLTISIPLNVGLLIALFVG